MDPSRTFFLITSSMVLRVLSVIIMSSVRPAPTLGSVDVEFKDANDDGCMPGTCPSSEASFIVFLLGDVRLVGKHNDVGVIATTAKDCCALEFHHEEEDRMTDREASVGQTAIPNSSVRPQRLE